MSSVHVVELSGCAPEPLMSYLKALGVLRLVSEQADPQALGYWSRDSFVLESRFSRDELVDFFLDKYSPTPILGPWAGASGFFGKDNRVAVEAIGASSSGRLAAYREAIGSVQRILQAEGIVENPDRDIKAKLLRRYRREMPDTFVSWMDAAMALGEDGDRFAPLLGTGGNDGRLNFTQNFMQRIVDLKLHENRPRREAGSLLQAGLWAQPVDGLGKAAVGQFSPGRAGGPNATQGMEGDSTDNPWDFLLGLEGALMLSAAAVRRLGAHSSGRASFPFTVRSRSVGPASSSDEEMMEARGELWMPLWKQAASAREIRLLFAEGRAEIAGRPAQDAVEFSRAVAGLGTDRGIHSFCRYGLFQRSGRSFLAVAMERFEVPVERRNEVDLLLSLDGWLADFRRGASGDAPQRLQAAARRIESKIFDYCRYGDRADLLGILIALGMAERELAVTGGQRGGKQICRPLQDLSGDWIQATNDGSPEFEIALALASLHCPEKEKSTLPVRANLEPVNRKGKFWNWGEADRSVVWNRGSLAANMIAVLERRLLAGGNASIDFRHGVRMETLARFIAGETNDRRDDRRIEELLWALMLVRTSEQHDAQFTPSEASVPFPRAFALLKPLFLPRPIRSYRDRWKYAEAESESILIRLDPRILPLVRAGRIREACDIAARRLLVSGLQPMTGPTASGIVRQIGAEIEIDLDPTRLAASLLLPIRGDELNHLLRLVTRLPEEDSVPQTEGVEQP